MKKEKLFDIKFAIFFVIFLAISIIFYFPVYWSIECITVPCNPIKSFIYVFDLANSRIAGINYAYIMVEVLISLLLAFLASKIYTFTRK